MSNYSTPPTESETLSREKMLPLYYQLEEILRREIEEGRWKPGELIPTEKALSEKYQVSLGTVRRAILRLVQAGLLYRKQGLGTFVSRVNFERSLQRFFRFTTNETGQRLYPHNRLLGIRVIDPPPKVTRILKLQPQEQVVELRRLAVLGQEPIVLQTSYLSATRFSGLLQEEFSRHLYAILEEKFGVYVIKADEFLEPSLAQEQEAELLKTQPGTPVILIERIAYTYGEVAVEFRKSVGRGDIFRYYIQLR